MEISRDISPIQMIRYSVSMDGWAKLSRFAKAGSPRTIPIAGILNQTIWTYPKMPWFRTTWPIEILMFSLGCLWTNPCYHTSQSTTVTNYTKGRSHHTGDNYWMHSFPPFTGHQNQRSQSSQMLAIWDCWFRISKYSVTRSLFLQQVIRRLRDLHKICHPVLALTEWHLSTNQKKSALCTVRMPQTHFYSPIPAIPTNPRLPGISIVHGIGPFEGQQIMRSLRGTSHLAKAWSWSRQAPGDVPGQNGPMAGQWKKIGKWFETDLKPQSTTINHNQPPNFGDLWYTIFHAVVENHQIWGVPYTQPISRVWSVEEFPTQNWRKKSWTYWNTNHHWSTARFHFGSEIQTHQSLLMATFVASQIPIHQIKRIHGETRHESPWIGWHPVTTRPLGVASSNALSLGDEAVEVWCPSRWYQWKGLQNIQMDSMRIFK